MRNSQPSGDVGAARRTILVLSVIASILLLLVTMFPAYPFRLVIKHSVTFVPVSKSISEKYHFENLIRDRYGAKNINRQILHDPWASDHIRGALGLSLVNCATRYKRPAVLRMLLSMHAPVNGLAGIEYGDAFLETTPLDTAVTAERPDLEIVQILLAAGANPYQTFSDGDLPRRSAFQDALTSQDSELVRIFKALKRPKGVTAANAAASLPAAGNNAMPDLTGR